MTRQVERRNYFKAALLTVNESELHFAYGGGLSASHNNRQLIGMPRAERRKLARAFAAGKWRKVAERREGV